MYDDECNPPCSEAPSPTSPMGQKCDKGKCVNKTLIDDGSEGGIKIPI